MDKVRYEFNQFDIALKRRLQDLIVNVESEVRVYVHVHVHVVRTCMSTCIAVWLHCPYRPLTEAYEPAHAPTSLPLKHTSTPTCNSPLTWSKVVESTQRLLSGSSVFPPFLPRMFSCACAGESRGRRLPWMCIYVTIAHFLCTAVGYIPYRQTFSVKLCRNNLIDWRYVFVHMWLLISFVPRLPSAHVQ